MLRLIIWPSMTLLGWTETKLWTLKYGSKSIQTSLILRQRPPKPYKLLNFFINFVTTVKSCHAPSIWKKMRWKSLSLPILKSITEIIKSYKSLYDFGGRCFKIKLDLCSSLKRHTWSNDQSQHVLSYGGVSLSIRSNFETRPSSLMNFGTRLIDSWNDGFQWWKTTSAKRNTEFGHHFFKIWDLDANITGNSKCSRERPF